MKIKTLAIWLVTFTMLFCTLPVTSVADEIVSDGSNSAASSDVTLRRVVSTESPMWIVHIDTWNYPDPDKIIDLIPEDILPYVVFNISLSVSWDEDTHEWTLVEYGYETAKSWLRTCAERGVWAMIQPASGARCHFPDYPDSSLEGTIFEEFFLEYPNFLGFNYCEQFWGFSDVDTTPTERYQHFANLLELTNRYGGYLVVSWCGNQWSASINPLAMIKQVPEFEQACLDYTENFILCEKYTQTSYILDMESLVLGIYLSGYCGNYGIRYDSSGWSGSIPFTQSTGLAVMLERFLKSGATVIDGPELIWEDDFYEDDPTVDDGYTERQWSSYTQFTNVVTDMFRKILEGAIRIPTREEVIENTKVVIIQDVETGSDDSKYSTYPTLFEGLYQNGYDGNLSENHSFYKSTGRYPAIPTVYALADDVAEMFEVQILQSEISERWATTEDKVAEFDELFPEEYAGNIYAGRNGNTWVVYNPLKSSQSATGTIPFQYNTADSIELTLSTYTTGIINEYSDSFEIYLNNYDENSPSIKKKDVIVINGCYEEPTITYTDRGINTSESTVTTEYANGVFTVIISHNGPIDLTINVSGSNTGRSTDYNVATIVEPEGPAEYTGDRQYEAEFYAYKNITGYVRNGYGTGISNYYGQGYLVFGTSKGASVKDTVSVTESGTYNLDIRYLLENSDVSGLALYVNGKKVSDLALESTGSTDNWEYCTVAVSFKKGENTVMLKATSELDDTLYLDCMIIDGQAISQSGVATVSAGTAMLVIGIVVIVAIVAVATVIIITRRKQK